MATADAAAAVPAGIRFWLRMSRHPDRAIRPLSPPFDPDTSTFADVALWGVNCNTGDRHLAWHVGQLRLGVDLALDTPLRDWMDMMGRRDADADDPVEITLALARSDDARIGYALACNADGLPWPLWDDEEHDPILDTPLGDRDATALRTLIGLRRGRRVKCVNLAALIDAMKRGNTVEPVFRTAIANMDKFTQQLDEVHGRLQLRPDDMSGAALNRFHRAHLAIIDLTTLTIDTRYGRCITGFEAQVRRHEAERDAAYAARLSPHAAQAYTLAVQRGQGVAFLTNDRHRCTEARQRIHDFIHEHPWLPLSDVEADDLVRRPSSDDAEDALAFARDEYARMLREIGSETYARSEFYADSLQVFYADCMTMGESVLPLDELTRNAEFDIVTGRASIRTGREFRLLVAAVTPAHTRAMAGQMSRDAFLAVVTQAMAVDYGKQSYRVQTADERAILAAVRRRPPNRLVDLFRDMYDADAAKPLAEHASMLNLAITHGRYADVEIRQVRQMLASLLPIYARHSDTGRFTRGSLAIYGAVASAGASEAEAAAVAALAAAHRARTQQQQQQPQPMQQ